MWHSRGTVGVLLLTALVCWWFRGASDESPSALPAPVEQRAANAAGHADAPASAVAPAPLAAAPREDAAAPVIVHGRVVDDRGALAGAEVRAYRAINGDVLAAAAADAEGSFRIAFADAPTTVWLIATHPGHDLAWRAAGVGGGPVELWLPRGVRLHGVVRTADGAPLTNATVTSGSASATTDVHGRYNLGAVFVLGRARVDASCTGYSSRSRELEVSEDETAVDFVLPPRTRMVVTVVDRETGAPIAGAEVCRGRGSPAFENGDAEGRFELHVAEGEHSSVWIAADGYVALAWDWDVPHDVGDARVGLARPAFVDGRVVDADGRPVAGADVEIVLPADSPRVLADDCDRHAVPAHVLAAWHLPGRATDKPRELARLRTDAEGAFYLQLLPDPAPRRVAVSHGDFVRTAAEFVAPEAAAHTRVEVQLVRGATLQGVVRRNGEPVDGGWVRWRRADAAAGGDGGGVTKIGDGGHYELCQLPAGELLVTVLSRERREVANAFVVLQLGQASARDFAWTETMATIRGRITTAAGAPVAGIRVAADVPDTSHVATSSAADGSFALDVLSGPAYEVTASRGEIVLRRSAVAAGSDVVFTWPGR